MGMRYTLRLFRGTDPVNFRHVIESAVADLNGCITWGVQSTGDGDLRTASGNFIQTLDIPYQPLEFSLCMQIARLIDLPWIELRIQEGTIWDYTLYRGVECVDMFSVCPQYWEDGELEETELSRWRGNPQLLAALWGLQVEQVSKYLVNWGYECDPDEGVIRFKLSGKAYPNDMFEYGQYEQFFDVLRTLGGVEPTEMHSLVLPQVEKHPGHGTK